MITGIMGRQGFLWETEVGGWSEASRGKHQLIAGLKLHVESIS
jgi:hypothetical protein